MTEDEMLRKMVAPGTPRPGKYLQGIIQIHITRACDRACYHCTQASQIGGKTSFMTPDQFRAACESLCGYFGVVGVFGGNPALSPHFEAYCSIIKEYFPRRQRGIWCNNPVTVEKAALMRATFDPTHSNLNVHQDRKAYDLFKKGWPECGPVGLDKDSRHSPCYVAMKDVLRKDCEGCFGMGEVPDNSAANYGPGKDGNKRCEQCGGTGKVYDREAAHELISKCDINQHWSAMIGVFRGELRAWFCEIAGAQAILHQDEPDYPDTGLDLRYWLPDQNDYYWWQQPMGTFAHQVRKHCHDCGVPMKGHGELANAADGVEQVSETHAAVYKPKRVGRRVELMTVREQLGEPLDRMTKYIQNGGK